MDIDILRKVKFFDTLNENELNEVLSVSKKEDSSENDKIFGEGDQGDKFYVVLSGAIRISKVIPGIGEEALCVLKTGEYFGEMALVDDSPRSADAVAHENCELLAISKKDLNSLMERNKDIGYKLLQKFVETLSKRLRETNEKIRSFFAMSGGF